MEDSGLKPATEPTPLRVVAAVLFDGDEVLACRRNPDKVAGGFWEFPGGKIEPGETPESALIREIREELDVSIVVDDELTKDVTPVAGGSIELVCLRAHLEGARPVHSSDHDRLLWLRATDLSQLEWAAPDQPAVRRLVAPQDTLHADDDQGTGSQPVLAGEPERLTANIGSWATSPSVRRSMLGNKARDTRPELAVRRIVHGMGLRYRVDYRPTRQLRVRGDMVFPRRRVVVFIDGCYWHGCPLHYTSPKSNTEYWSSKVFANRERDARTTKMLTELGWTVLRFWTHHDPVEIAEEIRKSVAPGLPPSERS